VSKARGLEAVLRRDRAVVVAALTLAVALAWAYLLAGAGTGMSPLGGMAEMPSGALGMGERAMAAARDAMAPRPWSAGYAAVIVVMWWAMMVGMMLPGAAPMILLFAAVNRRQREKGSPYVPTAFFVFGYVAAWGGFSLAAATLQWGLERLALLSPAMAASSVLLGGALLIAAGVYQLTPLKEACLRHCRSPFAFVTQHWRPGRDGALRMGLHHGLYCLGCCWALMGLLFYGGVMNVYWILGLALYVLAEKTLPRGRWLDRASGGALVLWGAVTVAAAL